jgi:hypothetical protein
LIPHHSALEPSSSALCLKEIRVWAFSFGQRVFFPAVFFAADFLPGGFFAGAARLSLFDGPLLSALD